jgi:hypothetical protein
MFDYMTQHDDVESSTAEKRQVEVTMEDFEVEIVAPIFRMGEAWLNSETRAAEFAGGDELFSLTAADVEEGRGLAFDSSEMTPQEFLLHFDVQHVPQFIGIQPSQQLTWVISYVDGGIVPGGHQFLD